MALLRGSNLYFAVAGSSPVAPVNDIALLLAAACQFVGCLDVAEGARRKAAQLLDVWLSPVPVGLAAPVPLRFS